jgi:hypothetical protein
MALAFFSSANYLYTNYDIKNITEYCGDLCIIIWELNEGVCLKFKKIIVVYKDFKLNVNLDKCCHENTPEYTQLAEHDI